MRGRFPLTIAHSDSGPNTFTPFGNLANGITLAPNPTDILTTGTALLPRGVDMTTPDPNDFARGATQSYNVTIERRLPLDIVTSVGYVGTRTDGTYTMRNLNYAESGGNANRQLFTQAGTATINTACRRRDCPLQLAPGCRESTVPERFSVEGRVYAVSGDERRR